jgi:hypothetical protein
MYLRRFWPERSNPELTFSQAWPRGVSRAAYLFCPGNGPHRTPAGFGRHAFFEQNRPGCGIINPLEDG